MFHCRRYLALEFDGQNTTRAIVRWPKIDFFLKLISPKSNSSNVLIWALILRIHEIEGRQAHEMILSSICGLYGLFLFWWLFTFMHFVCNTMVVMFWILQPRIERICHLNRIESRKFSMRLYLPWDDNLFGILKIMNCH